MMEFDGWLKSRSMDKSWVTVAQHDVTERDGLKEDLFMTSVLTPKGLDKALLTSGGWVAHNNDFGKAEFWEEDGQLQIMEKAEMCETVAKIPNVRIEPFAFLRFWNGEWPDRFEITQNFILFYNLYRGGKVRD